MKRSLIIIFNLILFFSLVTFGYAVEEYEFLRKWNTNKDTHQNPTGVAVDKDGNVYVAGQQKIVKYTRDGTYVFHIENIPNSDDFYISSHEMHVAVDDSGNIYVSAWDDFTIFKFDSGGNFLTKWDSWDDGGQTDNFHYPSGLAVDNNGNVYVCDTHHHRIVKLDSTGALVTKWSTWNDGVNDHSFNEPHHITLDDSGDVYVCDHSNQRIVKFDSSGNYLNLMFGSWGSGDGQFHSLRGIAVDFEKNIYAVDQNLHRVSKFDSGGNFIQTTRPGGDPWGGYGFDDYHFNSPRDIEVDYSGNVIIVDQGNWRIIQYKRLGAPTIEITNPVQDEFVKGVVSIAANVTVPDGYALDTVEFYIDGTPLGVDPTPVPPAYDYDWNTESGGYPNGAYTVWIHASNATGAKTREKVPVIVANDDLAPVAFSITNPADLEEIRDTETIEASTSDDNGITKVEFYVDDTLVDTDTTSTYSYPWDTTTVNDGEKVLKVIFYDTIEQFTSDTITVTVKNQEEIGYITKWYTDNPTDVVLDSDGNLYVSGNHKIKKYAPDGTYISKIEHTGSEDFSLDWYFFIAIDNSGNIYACNEGSHNVVKFDSNGNYVTKWGSFGEDNDQFHNPHGIACDSEGNVYVCDQSNHRISKFSSTGTFITSWGTLGGGDGQFNNPMGIAIDASDNVYVADRHNNRVQVFTSNGTFQKKWSSGGASGSERYFDCPRGIALDSLGNFYISDDCYHRILKFASDGTFITKWGSLGSNDLQFHSPSGVAVDSDFYVYVADRNNNRVVKFRSTWLPTVSITNPADNSIITAPITIQVTASSDIGIDKVEFYIEGAKAGEDTDDTDNVYEYSWNTAVETDGTYTLKAIAYNTQDTSQETDEISVIVNKDREDGAPFVSITNPAEGDIIRLQATLQAQATDPEELIDRVEFYVDDVKIGEDTDNTDNTYEYAWNATTVEDGERVIKVVAFDTIGQNVEETITVTVINHEEFGYIRKWNLGSSIDVELDKDGNLYVAGGHRISKYTPDGTLISRIENISSDYNLSDWMRITVDNLGNIYITNPDTHQVIKFDSNLNYVTKWGSYGDGNNQFNNPAGIAVDSDGYVYVCDQNNHRIVKFSFVGTFEKTWGTQGGNDGLFQHPHGIAVDASNNIYVTDYYNNRIQVFSSDGTFIRKWGQWGYEDHQLRCPHGIALDSEGNVYVTDECNYKVVKYTSDGTFLAKWGEQGSGDLQFECPKGIAIDSDFYVYVTDNCNNRFTKFKSTWRPTVAITNPADNSVLITSPVTIQATASSDIEISKVEFYINGSPAGEDTDNTDNIYEYSWNTAVETDGAFTLKAIAYNAQDTTAVSGEIYVVVNKDRLDALPTVSITNPAEGDTIRLAATLQAEASDAGGISKVEFYVDDTMVSADEFYPFEYTWDSTTVEDGEKVIKAIAYDTIGQNVEARINVTVINHEEFGYVTKWSRNNAVDVTVDKDGYLYVAGNNRITKYTPDGTFVFEIYYSGSEEFELDGWFMVAVDDSGNIYASNQGSHNIVKFDSNGNYLTKWGSYGQGDYQFYHPTGIAVDSEGNVYVCDNHNHRIVKYDSEGTLLTEWGTPGSNDGQFWHPHGITVDSSDNIYVTDRHNNRIQVFNSSGEFLRRWGDHGYENNQFRGPQGIAIDSEDNVYVVDTDNYRIVKYTSTGTFLTKWGTRGSGNLQFECMNGIAVDSNFYVYVTDNCNNRITKFKSDWRPTVEITNPADNSVLTAPVTIQATASSAVGISKVEFYKNGTLLGEATFNPDNGYYEYNWNTSLENTGAYTLKAIAYNAQNTTAESAEIYVVVKNITDELPTVSITNPAEGDTVRLQVTIQAEATDAEGIDRVEFYVDGIKIGEDTDNTDSTYEYTWDATAVEDGEKVIKVVAFDTIGQNAEESITVTITNHEELGYVDKWSHDHPTDVAVDKDGNTYIAGSGSISKYTPDGNLLLRIEEQQADYYFTHWMHVAVDNSGNIYTANHSRHSVVKFDSNGNYVTQWGSYGNGNYQFDHTWGIAVDSAANVYVVDHNNHRISKFNSDGTFLDHWGTDVNLNHPYGIAVDSSDNVFVTDNDRVNVFNPDGELIRRWGSHGYADTQFRWPQGIAVDSEGNVYVADTGNYRIVKYTSTGTLITKFGTQGSGDLQFECPNSVAVDPDFNVYVTDNCNSRVTIVKSTWLPAVAITNPADNSVLTEPVPVQVTASSAIGISKVEFYIDGALVGEDTTNSYEYFWDTSLESEGTYTLKVIAYNIQNIATESDEISVVVNNSGNEAPTVTITNPQDGEIIRKWVDIEADASDDIGIDKVEFYIADSLVSTDTEAPYVYNWETTTVGDGETEVKAVAYDGIGQNTTASIMVAVANQEAYEYISKFNTWDWGHPRGIAIDKHGHIYVTFCHRIVKFTSTGGFLFVIDNEGSDNNYQLTCDMRIAVDDDGNIYVSNQETHTIIKFDPHGSYLTKWGSQGSGDDQFNGPGGLDVDADGNVYVCDSENHKIVKFDSDGGYITKFGSRGHGDGQFQYPIDIVLDDDNNMYIAEHWNNRIQVLNSEGTFIRRWGNHGYGDSEFRCLNGIELDSEGNVYTADGCNNRVQKFSSDGTFITKWGSYGSGDTNFDWPCDLAVDSSGNAYVADHSNQRIVVFRIIGTPTVEITAPLDNSSVSGSVWITATAESEFGINRVEFYIDDVLEASRTESPYVYEWDTTTDTNGSHEIKAVAYNTDLKTTETSISVVVNNGEDVAPSVSITNINDDAVIRGTVIVRAEALDAEGIDMVEFYVDKTLIDSVTVSPAASSYEYSYTWDTTTMADGRKELKVVAHDTLDQSTWATVVVFVDNSYSIFSADLSGAAVIYIDTENKLRKIDLEGNPPNQVISTDPDVAQFQFGPAGSLYIFFWGHQALRDQHSYILVKVNPETNEVIGIDKTLSHMEWNEHTASPNIQFDGQDNTYYLARDENWNL
ncbi:SMP-30/gluconolactonase/LRE family protein, partial [bacterium]|nr:SMP-30/gluconolactonase/LRE family protein [bacterium]